MSLRTRRQEKTRDKKKSTGSKKKSEMRRATDADLMRSLSINSHLTIVPLRTARIELPRLDRPEQHSISGARLAAGRRVFGWGRLADVRVSRLALRGLVNAQLRRFRAAERREPEAEALLQHFPGSRRKLATSQHGVLDGVLVEDVEEDVAN